MAQIEHAHVSNINVCEFMAGELVELGIGWVVGIHAGDKLGVLPLPEVLALGVGIGAVVAVSSLSLEISLVRDHSFAELGNDPAIKYPLLFRPVVHEMHQAIVAFRRDVVG